MIKSYELREKVHRYAYYNALGIACVFLLFVFLALFIAPGDSFSDKPRGLYGIGAQIEEFRKKEKRYPSYMFVDVNDQERPVPVEINFSEENVQRWKIAYMSEGNYWMLLFATHPDESLHGTRDMFIEAYEQRVIPEAWVAYDPTNGTISRGVAIYDKQNYESRRKFEEYQDE